MYTPSATDLLAAISAARDGLLAYPAPERIRLTPTQYEQLKASPLCADLTPQSTIYGLPFIVETDEVLRAELAECLAELRSSLASAKLVLRAYDLKRALGEL